MRARGAQVTDIAVIVVAADDGVRPQTREAIDHAKAAEVPMIVAVNKIDKEGAQPERVRTEMTNLGLQPEEWGGDTMFVDVSAKAHDEPRRAARDDPPARRGRGAQGQPGRRGVGVVMESKLDPGRGAVVTVLVQRGTLKVGDAVVAGAHWGRVRAMNDYLGKRVPLAGPSGGDGSTRSARPGRPTDAVAEVVVHGADPAPVRAGHEGVADLQGAALHQDGGHGPRPRPGATR